jgi:hypothetical protein
MFAGKLGLIEVGLVYVVDLDDRLRQTLLFVENRDSDALADRVDFQFS